MNAAVPTPAPASPSVPVLDRFARFLGRHAALWLAAAILIALISSTVRAERAHLWMDDLYTYYITQQPTVQDAIAAVKEGCDGSPPLYALLARPLQRILGNNPLALRLPAVLGVGLSALFFFFFLRRRVSGIYAVAGVLAASISAHWFATQARPYSLELASVALALYSWQSAAEGRHRKWALLGLAFSLPFGIALQYYAVFLLLALGAGELVRSVRSGKLDIPVAGIIAASPLILLPHLPLIQAAALLTKHSWSTARWSQAPSYYLEFGAWIFIGLVVAVALYLLALGLAAPTGDRDSEIQPPPLYETAACGVLALLPLILLAISMYTTHFYVDRYACPAVYGLVAILVFESYRITRGSRVLGATLFVAYFGIFLVQYIKPALRQPSFVEAGPASVILESAPATPIPIAIPYSHVFMELWYYAPPALQARLVYPVSTALDIQYTDIDTDSLLLSALKHRSSMRISDYASFLESTPKFLYCHIGNHWMRAELIKAGYQLTLLRAWGEGLTRAELYSAERPTLAARK